MPNLPISRPLQDRDFQNLPLLFLFLKDPGKPRTEPCHPSMSGGESLLLQHHHHHHHLLLLLLLLLALVTLPLTLLLFLLLLLPLHQVIYMKLCRAEKKYNCRIISQSINLILYSIIKYYIMYIMYYNNGIIFPRVPPASPSLPSCSSSPCSYSSPR